MSGQASHTQSHVLELSELNITCLSVYTIRMHITTMAYACQKQISVSQKWNVSLHITASFQEMRWNNMV